MPVQIKEAIRAQAAYDVDPELSEPAKYMRNSMSLKGYKYLLAVGEHLLPLLPFEAAIRLC